MKFMILSYHPAFVETRKLVELSEAIAKDQKCKIYLVAHMNREAEPIYCVQLADTGKSK